MRLRLPTLDGIKNLALRDASEEEPGSAADIQTAPETESPVDHEDPVDREVTRSFVREHSRQLVLGAGAATLCIGAWALLGSGMLDVQDIQYVDSSAKGAVPVSQQDVAATAAITQGSPLATLRAGEVERRVAGLPSVEAVQVQRLWPRGVRVTYSGRIALASVPAPGGFALVDRTGAVFGEVAKRHKGSVLVDVPDGPERQVALEVLGNMPQELTSRVDSIGLEPEAEGQSTTQFRLVLRDKVSSLYTEAEAKQVRWGSSADSDFKAQVLMVLLDKVKKAAWFDVTAPGYPTTALSGRTISRSPQSSTSTTTDPATADQVPAAEAASSQSDDAGATGGSTGGETAGESAGQATIP